KPDPAPLPKPAGIAAAIAPKSSERRSPRKRPGQEATGESATVTAKSDAKTHRTPKALRAKFIERPISFRESSPRDESTRLADFRSAMRLRIAFSWRYLPPGVGTRGTCE